METLSVGFPDAWTLWHHLRAMGEGNANVSRTHAGLDSMLAAAAIIREVYGDPEGNVPAPFQLVFMIGWAPHDSQQQPLQRGSGQVSLKDLGLPDEGGRLDEASPDLELEEMLGRRPPGGGGGCGKVKF